MGVIRHTDVGLGVTKVEYHDEDAHELPEDTILIVSEPPSTYHKIYNLYAIKTGDKYHLQMDVEEIPEP